MVSKLSQINSAINISDFDESVQYMLPQSDRLNRGITIIC